MTSRGVTIRTQLGTKTGLCKGRHPSHQCISDISALVLEDIMEICHQRTSEERWVISHSSSCHKKPSQMTLGSSAEETEALVVQKTFLQRSRTGRSLFPQAKQLHEERRHADQHRQVMTLLTIPQKSKRNLLDFADRLNYCNNVRLARLIFCNGTC